MRNLVGVISNQLAELYFLKVQKKDIFLIILQEYCVTKAFENKTTGLHNLKTDDYVSKCEVKAVTVEEQENICTILDGIHGIIKLRKQQLVELDILIKFRFPDEL